MKLIKLSLSHSSRNGLLFLAFMAGLLPVMTATGAAAPPAVIIVSDVNGVPFRPLAQETQQGAHLKGTALVFIAHDCPIANSYAPEIARICREYAPRGIRFYVVYTETDLTQAEAKQHAHDYGYPCPALLDPKHRLVQKAGVTMTPEVAVFTPDGKLRYRGRIDDRYVDFGKQRYEPTRRDLRLALDALLQNKPIAEPETKSIGCFIPNLPRVSKSGQQVP